jgi:hypothetical protein
VKVDDADWCCDSNLTWALPGTPHCCRRCGGEHAEKVLDAVTPLAPGREGRRGKFCMRAVAASTCIVRRWSRACGTPGPTGVRHAVVRTFGTTRGALLELAEWLTAAGCTHAAVESTGVYWQPVLQHSGRDGVSGRDTAGEPDSVLRRLAPRAASRPALYWGRHAVSMSQMGERREGPTGRRAARSDPGLVRNQWAELMRRTFGLDVLACPRCGGRLRLVALIEEASVVQRILRHLGLPTDVPEARPARAPPRQLETTEDESQGAPEFDAAC